MTTKGIARQAKTGVAAEMLELPAKIAAAESHGQPVIVEWSLERAPMTENVQRLYATLGCLVRFVDRRTDA